MLQSSGFHSLDNRRTARIIALGWALYSDNNSIGKGVSDPKGKGFQMKAGFVQEFLNLFSRPYLAWLGGVKLDLTAQ